MCAMGFASVPHRLGHVNQQPCDANLCCCNFVIARRGFSLAAASSVLARGPTQLTFTPCQLPKHTRIEPHFVFGLRRVMGGWGVPSLDDTPTCHGVLACRVMPRRGVLVMLQICSDYFECICVLFLALFSCSCDCFNTLVILKLVVVLISLLFDRA